jgi:hypothetical protein
MQQYPTRSGTGGRAAGILGARFFWWHNSIFRPTSPMTTTIYFWDVSGLAGRFRPQERHDAEDWMKPYVVHASTNGFFIVNGHLE